MARTFLTSDASDSAEELTSERLRRVYQHTKVLVRLLAVYGPIVLVVLQPHRGPIAKAYLAVGIWAIEGVLWYWLNDRVANRRAREDGADRSRERYYFPA